jgi:putative ABC transport system permease protein
MGDTIVFLSQGYHGSSAAGKYEVAGIAKFSSQALNQRLALLPLNEAQNFFGTENMATSTAVIINEPGRAKEIAAEFRSTLDSSKYEVLDWEEAMPEIVQTIEADSAGGIIMLMVLYMVVTFGMFGTILMLVQERTYEFGVLLSIGMGRAKLWAVVFFEGLMMNLIGALLGVGGIYPLLVYFNKNPYELTGEAAQAIKGEGFEPLIPASLDPSILVTHVGIVMIVSTLITLYPAWVISRMNPVQARRS